MMKIVKEHINESFVNNDNKLNSLGIGKIQLIKNWLDEYDIENYTINDDFTIDVKGNVVFGADTLKKLPDFIQFNIVSGYFDLQGVGIETLKGCPYECNDFSCSHNINLKSLKYGPQIINNQLFLHDLPFISEDEKEKYTKNMKFLYRWIK